MRVGGPRLVHYACQIRRNSLSVLVVLLNHRLRPAVRGAKRLHSREIEG